MKRYPFALTVVLLALAAGCSSTPRSVGPESPLPSAALDPKALSESSIEISYVLNHRAHRFFAESTPQAVSAKSWTDQLLLKENRVDRSHYADLAAKVSAFLNAAHRQPASNAACRGPFTVTLRLGADTRTVTGCRTPDETGGISRISREAEFLLYSQK